MRNAPARALGVDKALQGLMAVAMACAGLAGCGERSPQRPAAADARLEGPATAGTASGAAAVPTIGAAGTDPQAAPAASAAGATPAVPAATLRSRLTADGPTLTFTLFSEPGGGSAADVLQVRSLEIRGPDGGLLQRIDGLDTQTPWSEQFRGLEVIDLDFDGFADLRLVEAQPAGPDLPYRHWRYAVATQQFVPAPELDALPGLQVDAARRELRSSWRDGPANYGVDVWTYRDASLVPLRRERRRYSAPGVYTLEVRQAQAGGGWKVIEKRTGRDR